jgi:uncharacterized protein YukE
MMSGGIVAQPDALAQSGQQFDAAADDLHAVARQLADRLAGLGDFWGDDQFGQAFARKYTGPVDKWMSFAGVASNDGLPGLASAVAGWAQAYQDGMQQETAAVTPLYNSVAT